MNILKHDSLLLGLCGALFLITASEAPASGCTDANSWHQVNASILPRMRSDYQAYLTSNPVGSVIPWGGGQLYRTADGALFVDSNGNGLRFPNLGSGYPDFAGLALSNPSVAATWYQHYGFNPCGTPRDPSGSNHTGSIHGMGVISADFSVQRLHEWLVRTYNSLAPGQSTKWNGHTVIRGGGYGELLVISPSGTVMGFHHNSLGGLVSNDPAGTAERQFLQRYFGAGSAFHASLPAAGNCGGPEVVSASLNPEKKQITYRIKNYKGEVLTVLNASTNMVLQSYSVKGSSANCVPCIQAAAAQENGGITTITVPATDFLLSNANGGLRFAVNAQNGGNPAFIQPPQGLGWTSMAAAICGSASPGGVDSTGTRLAAAKKASPSTPKNDQSNSSYSASGTQLKTISGTEVKTSIVAK